MRFMEKKFIIPMVVFFTVSFSQVGNTNAANPTGKMSLIHAEDIPFNTLSHDKTKGSKWVNYLGTKKISLIKASANAAHRDLHFYPSDITLFLLKGQITLIDESGKQLIAKVGDSVDIPANTPYGSAAGPQGYVLILVGEHFDRKQYK